MKRQEQQLEIPGIGQHLADLDWWKSENVIFTKDLGETSSMFGPIFRWECWRIHKSKVIYLCQTPAGTKDDSVIGYGDTERESILDFCGKLNIDEPFWW